MFLTYMRIISAFFCFGIFLQPISVTDQEIVEMILFPVVNEACRVLDEGIVVRASDLDVASVLGMSFPSYRLVVYALLETSSHMLLSILKSDYLLKLVLTDYYSEV